MNYDQLRDAQKAAPKEQAGLYRSVVAGTCLGSTVQPRFANVLKSATSIDDYIERIFNDPAMTTERVWSYIARTRDSAEWAHVLGPDDETPLDRPLDGATLLTPIDENAETVSLPMGEVTYAYVFHDGSFNREVAYFVGTVNGRFRCGKLELDGRYDVHVCGNAVFFEKWLYEESGARKGEIDRRISCPACGGKR